MLSSDLILLLLAVAVFFFILLAVAALILLGMQRSKPKKRKFTVFVSSSSGIPMSGVNVKLDSDILTTDSYGKCQFEADPGEHELTAMADGHTESKQRIRTENKGTFMVKLSRDRIRPEMKGLEAAMESARQAIDEIGSAYNRTIPDYLLALCNAVYGAALEEERTQSDKRIRRDSLKAAANTISQIAKGMVERRNLSTYARAKGKKAKHAEIPQMGPADMVGAKASLKRVDSMITGRTGKTSINPPLLLWKVSQKLLSNPTVFNITMASFLLDSAERVLTEFRDYL